MKGNDLLQKKIFFGFKNENSKLNDKNFKSKRKLTANPFHPHFWERKLLHNKENLE